MLSAKTKWYTLGTVLFGNPLASALHIPVNHLVSGLVLDQNKVGFLVFVELRALLKPCSLV